MNKKNSVFSKLTAVEMQGIKGGYLPPSLPKWYCNIGGGVYHDVCYSANPEQPCHYGKGACVSNGTCSPESIEVCVNW